MNPQNGRIGGRPILSLRSSRTVAVTLITAATFTDIVAYSIAVPVLPDLSRRLGASPAMIGLLFSSFGVTMLAVSVPIGAVSDRIGRKAPMLVGLVALAASTLLFAFAGGLPLLFAARLVQGAADAVAWVVGFALIADLYGPDERGRVTGIVLGGTSFAYLVGPSIGGWLYELGGIRLPFLAVTAMGVASAAGFAWLHVPDARAERAPVPASRLLQEPEILACAAAVFLGSASITMFEPVFSLYLHDALGMGPARIGTVFGAAALGNMLFHPMAGHAADRWGARRLTWIGLVATAVAMPFVARTWNYPSAIALGIVQAGTFALVATPSLTYIADATSLAGMESFGTAYGLFNMVWGIGLLAGPALGGYLFERLTFTRLALAWSSGVILTLLVLATSSRSGAILRR